MKIDLESLKKAFQSLRFRLLIGFILVVALAVSTVTYFTTRSTRAEFGNFLGEKQVRNLQQLALIFSAYRARMGTWQGIQELLQRAGGSEKERLVLTDGQGNVVGDSKEQLLGETISSEWSDKHITLNFDDRPVGRLYIRVSGKTPLEKSFLASVNRSALIGGIVAGIAGIIIALLYSRRIVGPVKSVTQAARKMEKGDLGQEVEVSSEGEIGELAEAFNSMSFKLQKQEKLRQNMVSDVAHELRTPLSSIKGYIEALREGLIEPHDEMIDSLHQEILLLTRLVEDLQDLTLADAGELELNRQAISLEDIVLTVVESLQRDAEEAGIDLKVSVKDSPLVEIDPQRIDQVLRNLLNNALRYTSAGGEVTVTLQAGTESAEVAVSDDGPGIPEEDLPHLFERFYRVEKSRNRDSGGSGLGLTIAKQIVEAHGGRIEVSSKEGQGSTFRVILPYDKSSIENNI